MRRIRYYAVFILANTALCHGTPNTDLQAHHACAGTVKAAISIASFYAAYKLFQEARASNRIAGMLDGILSVPLAIWHYEKLSESIWGLDSLAYFNLIGVFLYGAYKSGLSAGESFKTVYSLRNQQNEEKNSTEDKSFPPHTNDDKKQK